jgi:hypothetical protein
MRIGRRRPRRDRPGVSPVLQLVSIVIGNILITVAVAIMLYSGYDPHRKPSAGFLIAEIAIIFAGVLIATIEFGASFTNGLFNPPDVPLEIKPREGWWGAHRRTIYTILIFSLFLLHIYALYDLVSATGGGIHSPFAVMLAAPAIYGPFLANYPLNIMAIVLLDAAVIFVTVEWGGDKGLFDPARGVYAAASILMIVVAGLISAGRLSRANRELRLRPGDGPTPEPS